MDYIEKQKTGSTPYILIDESRGYMNFKGECFHEDVVEFFKDVDGWIRSYLRTDFGTFTFDCELEYFNSSTAQLLFNMLMEMDDHSINGNQVIVNWITVEDNDIIIECGEDFREEMENLTFHLIINQV